MALILAGSARLHGELAAEPTVVVDSALQEKKVTWPTDTKLYHKMIRRCWKLADAHGVPLRRRYRKEVRARLMAQAPGGAHGPTPAADQRRGLAPRTGTQAARRGGA